MFITSIPNTRDKTSTLISGPQLGADPDTSASVVVPSGTGFRVPDRSGTGLPGGGLSARRRRQRSSTSICKYSDLCHAPHVEHLRRPMLRSCGATDMELAANKSKTVSKSGTIQAFIKDIFV